MRDKISIQRVKELHPLIRDEVAALIDKVEAGFPENISVRVVEWYRSIDYQNQLYAKGRTVPGLKVTNAKGGLSYHNYGLAFDFAIMYNGNELSWDIARDGDKDGVKDWLEVVNVFKAAGYTWGADWDNDGITKAQGDKDEHLVDSPHLQKTFGLTVYQLFDMYTAKQYIAGTKYIQIKK